ncbi:YaiI/YqxD family protein [Biformimicrobium ophioploci]|uniref:UPF0178 protein MNKW57_15410 n=1 Tax=Biformimicrobium ophioploci TaxID=3036711 RepID=A0ABQ6LYQ3_9GAMM|nr:YaiI/YqxD family protein [Microbulbifer sp. NKW57]GMG87220.1 YaiI/YqxD family protein [Microbulbifer sp. NKW57]
MQIWVDADACPVPVKEVLFKAARRTETLVTFVANHTLSIPPSPFLKFLQVEKGYDIADNEIVRRAQEGDLVISGDIPLAAEVIEKGAQVINTRGERLTKNNIGARLNMRDFMETMRSSGVQSGGAPPYSPQDKQAFANQLDRMLAQKR